MTTPHARVLRGINSLIGTLVEVGLADDQNYAFMRASGSGVMVTFPSEIPHSYVLRERPYEETYSQLAAARAYHLRLLDGALVQLSYRFDDSVLRWHRLAFFPSPTLEMYQNDPELYREDSMYADVVDLRAVTVPVRFDYDPQAACGNSQHAASHLTLGQYTNCRIPVTAPVSPEVFMRFILQSFYNTPTARFSARIAGPCITFEDCATMSDLERMHVKIPG